jgi:hypothetical protein
MTDTTVFFALNPQRISETIDTVGRDASRTLDAVIIRHKAVLSVTAEATKQALDLNLSHAKSLLEAKTPYEAFELQSVFAMASFDAYRAHSEKIAKIAGEGIEKAIRPVEEARTPSKPGNRA